MKKIYILALMAATGSAAFAQSKINTQGLMLLDLYSQQSRLPADMNGALRQMSRAAEPVVDVLVETRSQAVVDSLTDLGYETTYISPNFTIVQMPLGEIRELEKSPEVRTLSFGEMAAPMMDVARSTSKVNAVHTGLGITFNGESRSFKGDGVIVGMFDTGFDPAHINFYNDDQTASRLKYYARFSGSNSVMPTVYTGEGIEGAPTDNSGQTHGTHVAGIMGGAYNGAGNYYTIPAGSLRPSDIGKVPLYGVAPHADLAIGAGPLYDNNILAGIRRIINYAAQEKKPVVINLSLGSNVGPHDASSSTVRALDDLAKEAIICIAAGNEGADQIHAGKVLPESQPEMKVLLANGSADGYIDAWSSTADPFTLSVVVVNSSTGEIMSKVTCPAGGSVTVSSSTSQLFGQVFSGTFTLTSNLSTANNRYNVRARANEVKIRSSYRTQYQLGLMAEGKSGAKIDFYTNTDAPFMSTFLTGYDKPDQNGTISDMACGLNTICVGSYDSRVSWYSMTGRSVTVPGSTGGVSSFTSWGELNDGRRLPHICAPGSYILSSYSGPYLRANQSEVSSMAASAYLDNTGNPHYWGPMQGTSMACPYVTGVVGLLLEVDNNLKSQDARDILIETASKTGTTDDIVWGAGKVSASDAVKALIRKVEAGVSDITVEEPTVIITPVDNRTYSICSTGGNGFEATLYSVSGAAVATVSSGSGEATLSAEACAPGVYMLRVVSGNHTETVKLAIR